MKILNYILSFRPQQMNTFLFKTDSIMAGSEKKKKKKKKTYNLSHIDLTENLVCVN